MWGKSSWPMNVTFPSRCSLLENPTHLPLTISKADWWDIFSPIPSPNSVFPHKLALYLFFLIATLSILFELGVEGIESVSGVRRRRESIQGVSTWRLWHQSFLETVWRFILCLRLWCEPRRELWKGPHLFQASVFSYQYLLSRLTLLSTLMPFLKNPIPNSSLKFTCSVSHSCKVLLSG